MKKCWDRDASNRPTAKQFVDQALQKSTTLQRISDTSMRINIIYISVQGNIQNYKALVEVYWTTYINSEVKRNGLTTKNEGVTSILRSLEHQFAIFFC
jgi:hypothetical protein